MTNWPEYNDALRARGDLTIWFEQGAAGQWPAPKRKTRKSWRKLHIGYDPVSGEIVPSLLTTDHVGDETALPELIAGIETPVARFLADGAYDGSAVIGCLEEAFGAEVEVIIPPPRTAVLGLNVRRDVHIEHIAEHGRMALQSETGYNSRAFVEAQLGRRKTVIGPGLTARSQRPRSQPSLSTAWTASVARSSSVSHRHLGKGATPPETRPMQQAD